MNVYPYLSYYDKHKNSDLTNNNLQNTHMNEYTPASYNSFRTPNLTHTSTRNKNRVSDYYNSKMIFTHDKTVSPNQKNTRTIIENYYKNSENLKKMFNSSQTFYSNKKPQIKKHNSYFSNSEKNIKDFIFYKFLKQSNNISNFYNNIHDISDYSKIEINDDQNTNSKIITRESSRRPTSTNSQNLTNADIVLKKNAINYQNRNNSFSINDSEILTQDFLKRKLNPNNKISSQSHYIRHSEDNKYLMNRNKTDPNLLKFNENKKIKNLELLINNYKRANQELKNEIIRLKTQVKNQNNKNLNFENEKTISNVDGYDENNGILLKKFQNKNNIYLNDQKLKINNINLISKKNQILRSFKYNNRLVRNNNNNNKRIKGNNILSEKEYYLKEIKNNKEKYIQLLNEKKNNNMKINSLKKEIALFINIQSNKNLMESEKNFLQTQNEIYNNEKYRDARSCPHSSRPNNQYIFGKYKN